MSSDGRPVPRTTPPAPCRADPLAAIHWARAHRQRFVTELEHLVSFPSVSAQGSHRSDVERCARWLAAHLKGIGMAQARLLPGARHPAVWAASRRDPRLPTVLVYAHYDVQPADPLEAWQTPPFQATLRSGYLHGRGTSDNKGPLLAHVKAIESYLATVRCLPINVVALFEGEEEIGSPGLACILAEHAALVDADVAVMSDTRMLGRGRPAISYSERGSVGLEIEVRGPADELHSGEFGGAVHGPIQALCEIVSSLHDRRGHVSIPGFYDRVRRLSAAERAFMGSTGPTDEAILHNAHVPAPWGEQGYSLYERTTIRPALTLNGVTGGYEGPGPKSVIPPRASVKMNIRLAADQDPGEVESLVRAHVRRITAATVQTSVRRLGSPAPPAVLQRAHPVMAAASTAYARSFGARPRFVRSGGTIPIVALLEQRLGIPTVLMGLSLPGDRMHAPNERFFLPNFLRGIETAIWFLWEAARHPKAMARGAPVPSGAAAREDSS
jgi:acetylornithine deacetylase/succinyl-diaminopimelate desuccinylase-like protein